MYILSFPLTVLFDLRFVLSAKCSRWRPAQCLRSVALCLHGNWPNAAIFLHVHIITRQIMETESVAVSGKGGWLVHWPVWGTKGMFETY